MVLSATYLPAALWQFLIHSVVYVMTVTALLLLLVLRNPRLMRPGSVSCGYTRQESLLHSISGICW